MQCHNPESTSVPSTPYEHESHRGSNLLRKWESDQQCGSLMWQLSTIMQSHTHEATAAFGWMHSHDLPKVLTMDFDFYKDEMHSLV